MEENSWINPTSDWSTEPDEVANAVTHGLGCLLSVAGAIALMTRVFQEGDFWRVVGCLIYAFSLVGVYAMSTMSHVCADPHLKQRYRRLDQGFIYLLIVGTYTPFSLAFLHSWPWWLFLGGVWSVAIFGFVSKIFWSHRIDAVAIWIYVLLGWVPIAAAPAIQGLVPGTGLSLMLVGGLFYTFGTLFLIFDYRARLFHAVWHLCVIAGSACHYFVILRFVAAQS